MRLPDGRGILPGLGLACIGELRVVVRELPVIQLRGEGDGAACVARDLHAIMRHVGGTRRNEADVQHAARLPRVPLVDRIPVGVQLIRLVEVGACLHRSAPLIGHLSAPVDDLAVGVAPFQFQPDVERVDGAAREEVPDATRAHDNIDARGGAGHAASAAPCRSARPPDPTSRIVTCCCCSASSPTANPDIACGASPTRRTMRVPSVFSSIGDTEKMSTLMKPDFRNFSVSASCVLVAIDERHGGVRRGEAVRVNGPVRVTPRVRSIWSASYGSRRRSDPWAGSRTIARLRRIRLPASCRSR